MLLALNQQSDFADPVAKRKFADTVCKDCKLTVCKDLFVVFQPEKLESESPPPVTNCKNLKPTLAPTDVNQTHSFTITGGSVSSPLLGAERRFPNDCALSDVYAVSG